MQKQVSAFATVFEVALGGRKRTDRSEQHHQKRFFLGFSDVEKVILLIKDALCLYSELCSMHRRGSHFQKIMKNKSESEKWS